MRKSTARAQHPSAYGRKRRLRCKKIIALFDRAFAESASGSDEESDVYETFSTSRRKAAMRREMHLQFFNGSGFMEEGELTPSHPLNKPL